MSGCTRAQQRLPDSAQCRASRNASDARRRVVPPPRGPSTTARSRRVTAPRSVPATPSLVTEATGSSCRGRPGSLTSRSYWRAMAIRISLSVSVMRSPDKSTVTVCRVPVNGNGP